MVVVGRLVGTPSCVSPVVIQPEAKAELHAVFDSARTGNDRRTPVSKKAPRVVELARILEAIGQLVAVHEAGRPPRASSRPSRNGASRP